MSETVLVAETELRQIVQSRLERAGVENATAAAVAHTVVAAERDGTLSHGLMRIPGYLASLKCGWVNGSATMSVREAAPGGVVVDADNGFSQGALVRGRNVALDQCRFAGVSVLALHNAHHFGALWPDAEWFADHDVLCLAFVNSKARIVAPEATRKVLGTNAMALGIPARPRPIVWDQASSVMAHGDVIIAAQEGRRLQAGVGVDAAGRETTDPALVLDDGGLRPFAAHKGFMIAFLVEVMAAALTGSRFGFEDDSFRYPGAQTSNGGQLYILVDPTRFAGECFGPRLELLVAAIREAGTSRLPGDRRYMNRARAETHGIPVRTRTLQELRAL